MIRSDRAVREEPDTGRVVIDPLGEDDVFVLQPGELALGTGERRSGVGGPSTGIRQIGALRMTMAAHDTDGSGSLGSNDRARRVPRPSRSLENLRR